MSSQRPRSLFWQLGLGIILIQATVLSILGWYSYDTSGHSTTSRRSVSWDRLALSLSSVYATGEAGWEDIAALQASVNSDGKATAPASPSSSGRAACSPTRTPTRTRWTRTTSDRRWSRR